METKRALPLIEYKNHVDPKWRNTFDVVVVAQETLHATNPILKDEASKHLRVVVGKLSTIDLKLQVFTDSYKRSTMIVTTDEEARTNQHLVRYLESNGIAMLALKSNEEGSVDLKSMLRTFASLKFSSVLVEDSPELAKQLQKIF